MQRRTQTNTHTQNGGMGSNGREDWNGKEEEEGGGEVKERREEEGARGEEEKER